MSIKTKQIVIAKELYDEIIKSRDNLNLQEKNKKGGIKKKKYNIIETSKELGLFLKSLRKS